jgi:hypothetical protein
MRTIARADAALTDIFNQPIQLAKIGWKWGHLSNNNSLVFLCCLARRIFADSRVRHVHRPHDLQSRAEHNRQDLHHRRRSKHRRSRKWHRHKLSRLHTRRSFPSRPSDPQSHRTHPRRLTRNRPFNALRHDGHGHRRWRPLLRSREVRHTECAPPRPQRRDHRMG